VAAPIDIGNGFHGATVLVVDDTPSKRYVLASWLRRGGYVVLEAATGTEALQRFRGGGIDLVVLDVRLPDMSGFDVCEQMKSDSRYGSATPVIHVSAAAIHSVDRTQGLERGADAYLVEPIDPDELLATVVAILRYYKARSQAELLAGRLTELARLSVALSAVSSQRDLLGTSVAGAARIFGSPIVLINTGSDGSRLAALTAGAGAPVSVRPWVRALAEEPLGVIVTDHDAHGWPGVAWPEGSTVRVLTVRPRQERSALTLVVPTAASADGAPVLTLLGSAVMSAMDAMRLRTEEHDLALTLQRSLLPRDLPHIPGHELAVRYVPAGDRAEIGGDFYEVARFGDELMVAVGDVGGHSLHAATIMAELRHATRAYLADGHGPAAVVDRLNRLMAQLMPGEIATLCLLAINLPTGHTRLANAGHPPPMISGMAGVRTIPDRSPLLGLWVRPATEIHFELAAGDTLLLYTDGLVETRTESMDDSMARLGAAAATVEDDLQVFAGRLLTDVGPEAPSDDIALIAIRRSSVISAMTETEAAGESTPHGPHSGSPVIAAPGAPYATFTISLPALPDLRVGVANYAHGRGLSANTVSSLMLVTSELATNAIRHGGGVGQLWVWTDDHAVVCRVSDRGPGMADPDHTGIERVDVTSLAGRGLWLVRQLSRAVQIDSGPQGTTVTATIAA
jgi:CheY-like chemotaxis protein/anti-sigma regulatory factor (Ser/Thr protein kinase)